MRCLHPVTRKYLDLMGQEHSFSCPCEKCIACLHNTQDSWAIRLNETNMKYGSFVYDTLTFNNSSLPCDVIEFSSLSDIDYLTDDVKSLLERYLLCDHESGELFYRVPAPDRSIIRDWIRNARELFVYHHGYRPKWKYFFCLEYGPRTSRPHFHGLFWGISKSDYIQYLKKPWRRLYGFTKTKFIEGKTDKDRRCIARYVSKYVSKGVFESPLVKLGFSPKPFRCISRGIGEEYLSSPRFDYFRSVCAEFLKSLCIPPGLHAGPELSLRRAVLQDYIVNDICEGWFKAPSEQNIIDLTTYFDNLGRPHALPRYYRFKLLNSFKRNVFQYLLQSYILARSELHANTLLAEFARSLGFSRASVSEGPFLGLGRRLFRLVSDRFALAQQNAAQIKAKARYVELRNHYKRSFNLAFVS